MNRRNPKNVTYKKKWLDNKSNPTHIAFNDPNARQKLFEQFVVFINSFTTDTPDMTWNGLYSQLSYHKPKFDLFCNDSRRLEFFLENSRSLISFVDNFIGREVYIDNEDVSPSIVYHLQQILALSYAAIPGMNENDCVVVGSGILPTARDGRAYLDISGYTLISLARYSTCLNPLNRGVDVNSQHPNRNYKVECSHVCTNGFFCVNPKHSKLESHAKNLARELCHMRCICLCRCEPKCQHNENGIAVNCTEHPDGCPISSILRERIHLFVDRIANNMIEEFYMFIQAFYTT